MEQSIGIRQWRLIIGVIILFIVSMVNSCTELRYSVSGKTAECAFTELQPSRTSRNVPRVVLTYTFTDEEGKSHKGSVEAGIEEGREILMSRPEVTYLPSSPETNTLTDERSALWPIIFGVMILALGVVVYRLHREAHGLDRRR